MTKTVQQKLLDKCEYNRQRQHDIQNIIEKLVELENKIYSLRVEYPILKDAFRRHMRQHEDRDLLD